MKNRTKIVFQISGRLVIVVVRTRAVLGRVDDLFPPLLEKSHSLATAIGAPKVAAARRVVTAAVRSVVAVRRSTDTGSPKNSNEGRPSNRN